MLATLPAVLITHLDIGPFSTLPYKEKRERNPLHVLLADTKGTRQSTAGCSKIPNWALCSWKQKPLANWKWILMETLSFFFSRLLEGKVLMFHFRTYWQLVFSDNWHAHNLGVKAFLLHANSTTHLVLIMQRDLAQIPNYLKIQTHDSYYFSNLMFSKTNWSLHSLTLPWMFEHSENSCFVSQRVWFSNHKN